MREGSKVRRTPVRRCAAAADAPERRLSVGLGHTARRDERAETGTPHEPTRGLEK